MAKQPIQPRKSQPQPAAQPVKKQAPAPVRKSEAPKVTIFSKNSGDLIYGRTHFMIFGIGFGLVLLGLLLMAGGAMPSPDVWDESLIYSARRITLAPIVMVAGFMVVLYGIFKKGSQVSAPSADISADA